MPVFYNKSDIRRLSDLTLHNLKCNDDYKLNIKEMSEKKGGKIIRLHCTSVHTHDRLRDRKTRIYHKTLTDLHTALHKHLTHKNNCNSRPSPLPKQQAIEKKNVLWVVYFALSKHLF